jgi:tRNA pseudouridine55 synthase
VGERADQGPDAAERAATGLRDGIAIVDKDAGWTSHDVVAKARGILRNKKIGHSGTLDPDATGVLLLGVGRVTRLLRFLTALSKTYEAEIVLGVATTTLDASGDVVATHDMAHVTADDVRRAAAALTGDIWQIPPMVSAVQVGGRRLHELAREGIEIEREPRPVTVHRFDVEPLRSAGADPEPCVYRAVVECSSGAYVRSLAADLGAALGGSAHLRRLRRTAIGSFTLAEARPLERIEVLPPPVAVRDFATVVVGAEVARAVAVGRVLPASALGLADGDAHDGPRAVGPWAVLDERGELLAMYERHPKAADDPRKAGLCKPAVVLRPA